jgi:hypothetical protein
VTNPQIHRVVLEATQCICFGIIDDLSISQQDLRDAWKEKKIVKIEINSMQNQNN